MKTHRFGQKIKLPSTLAIKHQILTLKLEDEFRAVPVGSVFEPNTSPAKASGQGREVPALSAASASDDLWTACS